MRKAIVTDGLRPIEVRLRAYKGKLCVVWPEGDGKIYVRPHRSAKYPLTKWSARCSKGACTWYGYGGCIAEAVANMHHNRTRLNAWVPQWAGQTEVPEPKPRPIIAFIKKLLRLPM